MRKAIALFVSVTLTGIIGVSAAQAHRGPEPGRGCPAAHSHHRGHAHGRGHSRAHARCTDTPPVSEDTTTTEYSDPPVFDETTTTRPTFEQ